ncbi:MAG TPA: hypothetical protein VEJ84_00085, partial [Acidimicrobiales bacterium]|nr:hypothetical protein [Acidimicrobiales bacterium]
MSRDLPGRDERELAEALDQALDRPDRLPVAAGTSASVARLVALADDLCEALPPPALPLGGRAEVRATALAVRAMRRRNRVRLLVAAAVTLLVGAVAGGVVSSAINGSAPPSTDLSAQLVLAKEQLNEASQALTARNPAKAQHLINAAAQVIQSQEGQRPTTVPPAASASSEEATIASLSQQVKSLKAQNSQLQAALSQTTAIASTTGPPTTTTTTVPTTTTTSLPTTTTAPAPTTTVA